MPFLRQRALKSRKMANVTAYYIIWFCSETWADSVKCIRELRRTILAAKKKHCLQIFDSCFPKKRFTPVNSIDFIWKGWPSLQVLYHCTLKKKFSENWFSKLKILPSYKFKFKTVDFTFTLKWKRNLCCSILLERNIA